MTAPERIWLDWPEANRGEPVFDEPPETWTQAGQTKYILATPEALAASPEVQALVMAERERCARIAERFRDMCGECHWSESVVVVGSGVSKDIAAAIRAGTEGGE